MRIIFLLFVNFALRLSARRVCSGSVRALSACWDWILLAPQIYSLPPSWIPNPFPATQITVIVNACATCEHSHIKVSTSGFDENQQTYKWILYTLVNVTQLGPVDCVQLNFKQVTDWLMENGAALGRRLCGRNDTPLVTVSEVYAITLSNSELASRISFIPPHLCIRNHSHSLQLRAQTFSARPL